MFDLLHSTPTLLISFLGFVITISFLVAIHEYGHFWVARKFGVKIEKFSIGFGKPIVKWNGKRDNTEYSISWIPLGGYVKMYGETADEVNEAPPLAETESDSDTHDISNSSDIDSEAGSFYALPAYKRFLIAFAGPAVNLIFAVLALWFLFVLGTPAFKPYIGSIQPQSVFAAGNVPSGSQIFSVNGSETPTMTDATMQLVSNIGNANTSLTTLDDNGIKRTTHVDMSSLPKGSELAVDKALGFRWEIDEAGDFIDARISDVIAGLPAAKAGMQAGDVVTAINGAPIVTWKDFVEHVAKSPNTTLNITVHRNGYAQQFSLTPTPHPQNAKRGYIGVRKDIYKKYQTVEQFGVVEALPMAVRANYLRAALTLKVLGRMITGNASVKSMGGPLTIADYSGKTLRLGYVEFLQFLAALSLALAVMNLLPIPVLDGGLMMLCALEMIRGKPVSDRAADLLLRFGMAVILTFMVMVLSVDIWKYTH